MVFRNDYYFLSNMYPCNVTINLGGVVRTFSCAESAFQACKCPSRADEFVGINGFAAKKLGRNVQLREDWNQQRNLIMSIIVKAKFEQNPDLMEKLLAVKGTITEDNTWGDTYWGVCNGVGQNHLGKILMSIRDSNRSEKTISFTGRRPKDLLSYAETG